MDGSQKSLKQSLQFQLSVASSLVILSITLAASIFSFVSAFREANELQDDQLRQIAALFNQHNLPIAHVGTKPLFPIVILIRGSLYNYCHKRLMHPR